MKYVCMMEVLSDFLEIMRHFAGVFDFSDAMSVRPVTAVQQVAAAGSLRCVDSAFAHADVGERPYVDCGVRE